MSRLPRWPYALPLLVLGLASGLASVAVHDKSWLWFLLALAAPVATAAAASPGLLRLSFVAGWFGVLLLAMLGRPEGDYVITGSVRGYALLGSGLLLLMLAVATLARPVRTAP